MTSENQLLRIDPDLRVRLSRLASRAGVSFGELAENVLRSHADQQERMIAELAEDEERWQRYIASGQTVSYEVVRGKLRALAAEASRKAERQ